MIVYDVHVHWLDLCTWNPTALEVLKDITNNKAFDVTSELNTPRKFADYLKKEGLSRAIILSQHSPLIDFTLSEKVAEFCRSEKDFFIPFASVNPNYDTAPDKKLEHYVTDLGMKGLKLLPSYDLYYPNDSRMYKVYQVAERLKIPVMLHIGSSKFKGTRMKYCDPIYIDDIAQDFPDLTIIMSHGGRGFEYEKAFFLSTFHKNVYIDVTGLPPKKLLDLFPRMESNIDKFMFGSDFPANPKDINEIIEDILNLPMKDGSKEKLLYKNAEKVIDFS